MKRLCSLVIGLAAAVIVLASPRSLQEAQQIADQYFTSHAHQLRAPKHGSSLQYAWTASQPDGMPAFYVFNRGEEDGFIIVSAEDITYSVLAYSDSGHFSETDMPANTKTWLTAYCHAIHHAVQASSSGNEQERVPQLTTKTYIPVAPLCQTQWDQDAPYNELCPLKNGQRTLTGCVATAAAQIMKVHNHPVNGVGSHSYYWHRSSRDSVLLSADFGNTTYQWSAMPKKCTNSSQQEIRDAVATLMYHCGVACNMSYQIRSLGSSWAYFDDMMYGLVNYFNYDLGIRIILKDYLGEGAFLDSIHADLQNGLPVYFSGRTRQDEGHAFVCDGMDANGLVHINWGWGGNGDAYYRVSVLDPDNQGAGGSAGNDAYTVRVCAYTHIQPNQNDNKRHTFICESMEIEKQRLSRNEKAAITIDTMSNLSLYTWEGTRALLLYKNGQLFDILKDNTSGTLYPYYYYYHVRIRPSLASVPEGEYEVIPAMAISGQPGVYEPIYLRGKGICRCSMRVTSDSIFIEEHFVPESIEPVYESSQTQSVKRFQDGQFLIDCSGRTYTLTGKR